MSDPSTWFSPQVMRLLASALLHFLWQGFVLGAVCAVLMTAVRSAAMRYALAVSILVIMVASPVATFWFLQRSSPTNAPSATLASSEAAPVPARVDLGSHPLGGSASPDMLLWMVRGWMLGVVLFSLRTAGGMLLIERIRHKKASPLGGTVLQTCQRLQSTLGIRRAIRFCQCNGLDVPAVVGWFRPVVLVPMTVLTGLSQAQLEAVIVHELAHIKRWDYFVNLFQVLAETMLFYHPAIWWVSRRIRLERENCCDDLAVLVCGNVVEYARALTFMEGGRTAPSFVMAANSGPLTLRVMRLLGSKRGGAKVLSFAMVAGTICLGTGIYMSQAFLRVAHASPASQSASATATRANIRDQRSSGSVNSDPAMLTESDGRSTARPERTQEAQNRQPARSIATVTSPAAPGPQEVSGQGAAHESYIDSLKAAGLSNVSVDDLIAMKIQGVTGEYVRQLHELGVKPSPEDLVAMRIQGVTPEYVRGMQALGMKASVDDLVAMKIQGVSTDYVRSLHDLGLKFNADDLVAMRIQRVTPDYVREIHALGLEPGVDDLVAMQIQGVTPAYIKNLSSAGVAKTDADTYVALKVQGVTPEFVEKARQHGFQNLTPDQLITLKHAGVL